MGRERVRISVSGVERLKGLVLLLMAGALAACATPADPLRAPERADVPIVRDASVGSEAARTATSMIGTPYRYGGASPSGFDCSGLVVYSYSRAGFVGLPHSAARIEQLARPVSLAELEPGDLLFFRLAAKKTSHVGVFVGERTFVHAPSSGKRVERVSFDHVYWGPRLTRAGRLQP